LQNPIFGTHNGVDLRWCTVAAPYFVHKILHGTPPGDLPVEFPNKMVLSVNLKTAKALALKISESFCCALTR
jgi:putative ABC transport system substrate-binding protein